ncbi:golgin-45-like [Tubulanus polymorphus]|uniref:golgin-45-like n=1 Tax=Tubulanus polymorphus TaxID=672921 RepID=UPI003DA1CCED
MSYSVTGDRLKTAKFIPYEPTKAATSPPISSTPTGARKTNNNLRRYDNHRKTDALRVRVGPRRPDNLISYPKPYTVVQHDRQKRESPDEKTLSFAEETSISAIITPENTPSVERKLVLQDSVIAETDDFPVAATTVTAKRELFSADGYSSKYSQVAPPANKDVTFSADDRSRPVNKVDPLVKSDDQSSTVIDIGDLEMHEIDRLRRLNKSYLTQIEHLNQERNEFKSELDAQFQVNTELKKLLVASVGEDLQHRVERIIREKAHMTNEIGDYHRRISTDGENLDKVSIQADMWRSKFLASRVMVDELAKWKAHLSVRYKEIQKTLEDLLHERQQLQSSLLLTYRHLQLVKDAFLPNPVKIHPLQSQTVDNLAKMNSKLASDLKQQLLGNIQSVNDLHLVLTGDKLTAAEQHAQQILISPQFQLDDNEPETQSMAGADFRPIERYHPHARFEHVTVNCCANCNGDIHVV